MNISKIKHFIHLIEKERTGSPQESAIKIGTSERMVYKYLQILKQDFNTPVVFCRKKNSYVYTEKGNLNLYWQKK